MSNGPAPISFLAANASPRVLFAAGAALLPAFLFQQDLVLRAVLFVVFLLLNAVSGRRVRVLQYAFVGAGIAVFNLIIPTGRVLVSILGLPVTEGALKSGVAKALAMIGLVALSQFSIRADLRFPGKVGGLLGASLQYFERIMGQRRSIDRRDIIGSIDRVLLSVHSAQPGERDPAAGRPRTTIAAAALLASVVLASWGALAWTFVHPRPFWG